MHRTKESKDTNWQTGRNTNPSCMSCDKRQYSQWKVLEEEEVRALNNAKSCNIYQPGQVIFYQGNPCMGLYCIESGTVAMRKIDIHGNSVVINLAHDGQTLGYRAFFSESEYSVSAEAVTACRICFVPRDFIRDMLKNNLHLGYEYLSRLASDLGEAEDDKMKMSTLPVRTRLAHLLLSLKEHYGKVGEDGILTIELPLSRQDMASMLAIRPETLSRAIRALEKDQVAHFERQSASISDLDALLDEIENPIP
ncbi:MAG: Crp/Fnr family transcriptional regulator [Myxococcales bacterium]|nr:Crp/Fnr family transcriptional regulator [Myxococcales bacterium]